MAWVTSPHGTSLQPGSAAASIVIAEMERRELGLRETARELGIGPSQFSRVLKGEAQPTLKQLAALRKFARHEPEDWLRAE